MLPIVPRLPQSPCTPAFPFRLNTGRVRDHWHTMTRTGLSARLSAHIAEPFLELYPDDAGSLGLKPASLAIVSSPAGRAVLRVLVTDRVRRGDCFAPMHWTGQTAPTGRIDAVVAAVVDPVSGQPESKATAVSIAPFAAKWFGFAVCATEFQPDCDYWARAVVGGGMRAELAGLRTPDDWEVESRRLFNLPHAQVLRVQDAARGSIRLAFTVENRVVAALFISPEPVQVARQYLAGLLGSAPEMAVLAGRPGLDRPDPGAIICACFDVGMNSIVGAIANGGCVSIDALGVALRAGTNCGSCKPELRALIARHAPIALQAAE